MSDGRAGLADWLERQIFGGEPFSDVTRHVQGFTDADAYRVRAELVARRLAAGDTLTGYKVAGSSVAVRADEHVEGPIVGCVMGSRVFAADEPVAFTAPKIAVEAEIGVLLGRDLAGPDATLLDAYGAAAAVFPAFELLALGDGPRPSHPARIVASNFRGGFVFGGPLRKLLGLDLRTEGMTLSVNGTVRASATAIEVLGNPLAALPLIANTLADSGQRLKAGMIVMTGSIAANTVVQRGDRIEAEFSRLGRIAIRLA